MSIKPKKDMKRPLAYFEDSGTDRKKLTLLLAAYFDKTETAKKLIDADPDQINRQDPHSGLTALHISIFRQNGELVEILARHPHSDLTIKDNFNRRAIDMLDYTTNQQIFECVTAATYPEISRALEDEAFEAGVAENKIVPLRPGGPKPP